MAKKGYEGSIKHTGVQVVKAPYNEKPQKGKSKSQSGKDLRTK